MPHDPPTTFTAAQVRVIEAALINAKLRLDLTDGAEVRFGDEAEGDVPAKLDHTRELRQLSDALRILGYDMDKAIFLVPARPDLPQL